MVHVGINQMGYRLGTGRVSSGHEESNEMGFGGYCRLVSSLALSRFLIRLFPRCLLLE
jgi:hypothetical protein